MCRINSIPNDSNKCDFELFFTSKIPLGFELPIDDAGFCVFHSSNLTWKRASGFVDYLNQFIKADISSASRTEVKFVKVIFVKSEKDTEMDFKNLDIPYHLKFEDCVFEDPVSFNETVFRKTIEFLKVKFQNNVYFRKIKCLGSAFWNDCVFIGPAYFNNTVFDPSGAGDWVSFNFSTFKAQANFPNVVFKGRSSDINFQVINFEENVYFTNSEFNSDTLFNGTQFNQTADFRRTNFAKSVKFNKRTEERLSFFNKGIFSDSTINSVEFSDVVFASVDFNDLTIIRKADFISCLISNPNFDQVKLKKNCKLMFKGQGNKRIFKTLTSFVVDESNFEDNALISFLNCDVSKIYPSHLTILHDLIKLEKVYFDEDCNFEVNTTSRLFEGLFNGDWWAFKDVLDGLSDFVRLLIGDKGIQLDVIPSLSRGEFLIKIHWEKIESYNYFVKISDYYFALLAENAKLETTERISRIFEQINFDKEISGKLNERKLLLRRVKLIIDKVVKSLVQHVELYITKSPSGEFSIIPPDFFNPTLLDSKIKFLASSAKFDPRSNYNTWAIDNITTGIEYNYIEVFKNITVNVTNNMNNVTNNMKKIENNIDSVNGSFIQQNFGSIGDITTTSVNISISDKDQLLEGLNKICEYLEGANKTERTNDDEILIHVVKIAKSQIEKDKFDLANKLLAEYGSKLIKICNDIGINILAAYLAKLIGI